MAYRSGNTALIIIPRQIHTVNAIDAVYAEDRVDCTPTFVQVHLTLSGVHCVQSNNLHNVTVVKQTFCMVNSTNQKVSDGMKRLIILLKAVVVYSGCLLFPFDILLCLTDETPISYVESLYH